MAIPNIRNSLSLMLPIKIYKSEKILLIFEKGEKYPQKVKRSQRRSRRQNQRIKEHYSKGFQLHRCIILHFFPEERSRLRIYLFISWAILSNY